MCAASSFETDAIRDTISGTAAAPLGPATTGSLLPEVIVPISDGGNISFGDYAFARGAADDTGASAVAVDGQYFGGGSTLYSLTATSTQTSEITNNTGGLAPFYYNYILPGPRLTISDFAGISNTGDPTIRVFYDFRISLDFGAGFFLNSVSQGELMGGL